MSTPRGLQKILTPRGAVHGGQEPVGHLREVFLAGGHSLLSRGWVVRLAMFFLFTGPPSQPSELGRFQEGSQSACEGEVSTAGAMHPLAHAPAGAKGIWSHSYRLWKKTEDESSQSN